MPSPSSFGGMTDYKKKVAYKVRIGDLVRGRFVKREGWEPSYIAGKGGLEVSRVSIISLAVGLDPDSPSLVLDDGSGRIEARAFAEGSFFDGIEVGSLVHVIGRPRMYNDEIFLAPEIVKRLDDHRWAEVRSRELAGVCIIEAGSPEPVAIQPNEAPAEEVVIDDGLPQKVFRLIKEMDKGDGADVDEVIRASGVSGAEKVVQNLLMNGDIFEVKNGRLKVLE